MKKTIFIYAMRWDKNDIRVEDSEYNMASYVLLGEREIEIPDSMIPSQDRFEEMTLAQDIVDAKKSIVDADIRASDARETLKDLECRLSAPLEQT